MSLAVGKYIIPGLRSTVAILTAGATLALRRLGFWTAILLPMVYLPLILVSHPWVTDYANFTKLVIVHLTSVIIAQQ